jgi:hypothetical protein
MFSGVEAARGRQPGIIFVYHLVVRGSCLIIYSPKELSGSSHDSKRQKGNLL